MAEKGSNGAPWLIGLRSACEVKVIISLESTHHDGQVARIGMESSYLDR